jgi:hypothetical protein
VSRISTPRVEPGDSVTAADLNARYDAFTQPGALNAYNTRDAAFDLAHFQTSGLILINSTDGDVGTGDLYHTAPNTVSSSAAGPATPTLITGAVGNVVATGTGWATTSGDVLRVYWNLQCRPRFTGTPMYGAGALGLINVSGGAGTMADGNHVWLLQLEWDITSAALGNFVPVPGQSQGTGVFTGGLYGMALQYLAGTTVIPAWHTAAFAWVDGTLAGTRFERAIHWYGASGSWVYQSTGQTVYGFRLRAHGIYHPYQDGSGNNGFVLDTNVDGANQFLEYDSGHIVAMQMRVS